MKITKRQLKKIIKEDMKKLDEIPTYIKNRARRMGVPHMGSAPGPNRETNSDARAEMIDAIGSQEMADAKRAVGAGAEAQAEYLGISVSDWHDVRQSLDDHYEDRHMEDQMEWEEEESYPLDSDGDGNVDWNEIFEMKITRAQLERMVMNEFNVAEAASRPGMIGIQPRWGTPASRDFPGALENIAADIQDMIDNAVGQVDLEYSDDRLTKRDILDFVIRMLTEELSILPGR